MTLQGSPPQTRPAVWRSRYPATTPPGGKPAPQTGALGGGNRADHRPPHRPPVLESFRILPVKKHPPSKPLPPFIGPPPKGATGHRPMAPARRGSIPIPPSEPPHPTIRGPAEDYQGSRGRAGVGAGLHLLILRDLLPVLPLLPAFSIPAFHRFRADNRGPPRMRSSPWKRRGDFQITPPARADERKILQQKPPALLPSPPSAPCGRGKTTNSLFNATAKTALPAAPLGKPPFSLSTQLSWSRAHTPHAFSDKPARPLRPQEPCRREGDQGHNGNGEGDVAGERHCPADRATAEGARSYRRQAGNLAQSESQRIPGRRTPALVRPFARAAAVGGGVAAHSEQAALAGTCVPSGVRRAGGRENPESQPVRRAPAGWPPASSAAGVGTLGPPLLLELNNLRPPDRFTRDSLSRRTNMGG